MKRQILNTTDSILVDAEKIVLMQIQPQDDIFCLNVTLDNARTFSIASFDDREDAKEVFTGLTSYIWNNIEKNVYHIRNNDCFSKTLARMNAIKKPKRKTKELALA